MSDIIIIQGQIRFNPPITNQKVADLKREHNFKYIDITNNYVTCLVPYNWIPAKGFRDELEIFANNMKGKLFRERFSGEILAYKGSPNAKSAWRYFIKYGKVQSDNNAAFKFIKYYKPKPKRHAKWVKPEHMMHYRHLKKSHHKIKQSFRKSHRLRPNLYLKSWHLHRLLLKHLHYHQAVHQERHLLPHPHKHPLNHQNKHQGTHQDHQHLQWI